MANNIRFLTYSFILILAVFAVNCRSASKPEEGPSNPAVDALFKQWEKPDSPGAAVAVLWNNEVVYKRGYGSAQLEYEIPITSETVFHVASVSKQFTAFAVVLLAQEGKLSLDDEVRKYIAEVPDFGKTITLRHLIHHVSGLRDQWEALAMAGWRLDDVITKDHILTMVRNQKELNFAPGERYLYCNTGYTLLAEVVARVTGQSFPEWTKQHIFEPLGMTHTHFHDDHQLVVKNRAYSYGPRDEGGFRKNVLSYANVGATSLFTTAEDLVKWAGNFFDPRVGGAEVVEQVQQQGVLNNGRKIPYAFGLGIGQYRGLRQVSHSGGDAGFRSHLLIFPEKRFAVAVLSNLGTINPGRLAQQVADVFLGAEMRALPQKKADGKASAEPGERKPIELDPMTYEAYVGRYLLADATILEIEKEGERIFGTHSAQGRAELFPLSPARFFVEDADVLVNFLPARDGYVERVALVINGSPVQGKRLPEKDLSPEQMQGFTGIFESEELGTFYRLVVEDGKLLARHRRHGDIPLIWTMGDTFTGRQWFFRKLEFVRNDDGEVSGFLLTGGRVWNMRFEKR